MVLNDTRLIPRLTLQRPPLPSTVRNAAEKLDSTDALSSLDVVAIISEDPMALLGLMKRANSAYYGLGNHVDSISHAIEVLSPGSALGYLAGFDRGTDIRSDSIAQRLYRHAGLTARLAHRIVTGVWPFDPDSPSSPGTVYTAGMLHGLGRIVLVHSFPEEAALLYRSSFVRADSDDGEWQQLERLQFGADHIELGEIAARKLRLPDSLAGVIQGTGAAETPLRWTAAVDIARKIVNSQGYGIAAPVSIDSLEADPAWHVLHGQQMVEQDQLHRLVFELRSTADATRSGRTTSHEITYASDRASRSGIGPVARPPQTETTTGTLSID